MREKKELLYGLSRSVKTLDVFGVCITFYIRARVVILVPLARGMLSDLWKIIQIFRQVYLGGQCKSIFFVFS